MNFIKTVKTFPSSNASDVITYYVYEPLNSPKAIFQISHGMCEYIERYEPFIEYLTSHHILVCGNDHLGHKGSVKSKNGLGFFAERDGWKCFYTDLSRLTNIIRSLYPELPFILFGHSMGSFIARAYLSRHSDLIDGAILCGSAGRNPMLPAAKALTACVRNFRGPLYRSPFIDKALFGTYNSHYTNVKSKFDWLTHDEKIIQAYIKDDYCNFLFTVSGYQDLIAMNDYITSDGWYHTIPRDIPIFLISGDMDPVGNYGKGIREVEDKLKAQKMKSLSVKLYPGMRHEILNEIGKEEVYEDILLWISKILKNTL